MEVERRIYICASKLTIIGSDNGLLPGRRQAIIWTNTGILLIWTLGTTFSGILSEIHTFSFKKIHLNMSSAKWLPFCLALNVQTPRWHYGKLIMACFLRMGKHQFFPWWRHQMETFSALLAICAGNSPVPGELPAQRPVTRSFDVFFDLRLNKRLSKQSWGWWFETLSPPLWRHRNVAVSPE